VAEVVLGLSESFGSTDVVERWMRVWEMLLQLVQWIHPTTAKLINYRSFNNQGAPCGTAGYFREIAGLNRILTVTFTAGFALAVAADHL